jgi:hypothetical protein
MEEQKTRKEKGKQMKLMKQRHKEETSLRGTNKE